jgi:aminoglycoside phosphotransferase (APT) family kinase protein
MSRVATDELVAALEPAVGRIGRLDRRASEYCSSYTLEELDVELAGGAILQLMFKDLGRESLLGGARAAKPDFLYDPRREIEVYRRLLASQRLGTAACYAAVCDESAGRYWLFLERVDGLALKHTGELDAWQAAARWLARLHAIRRPTDDSYLMRHDVSLFRLWPNRARHILAARDVVGRDVRIRIDKLAAGYEAVVERLTALPVAVIHGEFYASNVLVAGERVCPLDWEMAGVGPGLIDLAALTAGKWTDAKRAALAGAYHAALDGPPPLADLLANLDWCRLHLAMQWLGWSSDWAPPPEHVQDWLGEVLGLSEKLRLL